jgi:hypothetical protein
MMMQQANFKVLTVNRTPTLLKITSPDFLFSFRNFFETKTNSYLVAPYESNFRQI